MAFYKRRVNCGHILATLLLFALADTIRCYEKTLRKMVRNQSKMVQRPFDDKSGILAPADHYLNPLSVHSRAGAGRGMPVRTQVHRPVRPGGVLPSVDIGHGKTYTRIKIAPTQKYPPDELKSSRTFLFNTTLSVPHKVDFFPIDSDKIKGTLSLPHTFEFYPIQIDKSKGNGTSWGNAHEVRRIPASIFPPVDDNSLQTIETSTHIKESIVIPSPESMGKSESDDALLVKGIFRPKVASNMKPKYEYNQKVQLDVDGDKADFFMEIVTTNSPTHGGYNMSLEGYQICAFIKKLKTNINAQKRFSEFDIEPPWMTKKHYWNNIFNSRYEFLMRNSKWPPLKVILIPRTHVHTIWKNTFEHYNNNSAHKILSNVVKKMKFYPNLTFTWNEISHLSKWWKTTTSKNRAIKPNCKPISPLGTNEASVRERSFEDTPFYVPFGANISPNIFTSFRKYVKSGRLEITTGGWVETDEATTHIFGLVHNLIEGHQWLSGHLSYAPDVAWLTNSVTHSPTMAYLLAVSGITKLILTNVHFSWEEYLAEYQISDFVWVQNWVSEGEGFFSSELNKLLKRLGRDRYPRNSVLSHYLQFNADGFEACGPNRKLCATDFNFFKLSHRWDVTGYNIKDKSELILEQYSKTGTLTPHNIIIAPIGGPNHFATQEELDYQYNNYQKIAEFINVNRDIYKASVEFGTPIDYFKSLIQMNLSYPSLKGDFLNFADVENGTPAYWTGFFTSRPLLKILLRRLHATMRSTEILFAFALTVSRNDSRHIDVLDMIELLTKSRETVARLLDRNVISGTLSANILRYVHEMIITTAKDCWKIQELMVTLLTTKKSRKYPYVRKYVYRNGEFISVFRTVGPEDNLFMFNSLSHERYEIIELFTKIPNIRIIDHNKKDVTVQVNPVWKYDSKNNIVISKRFFKVIFAVLIPPLTIELFKIKEASITALDVATIYCVKCIIEEDVNSGLFFPFHIQPIEKGDIQLENYKHRLVFDGTSGFLKTVVEKDSDTKKQLGIDYGAFTSSGNSGIFLFNPNATKPFRDILKPYRTGLKSKIFIILTGQLITEFTSVYGRLLHHTTKIFNLLNSPLSSAILVESKIDLDISPNNRDVELFMSVRTDINNGYPPEIYIDNNGFQYTPRTLNTSKRIESNVYPMTTLSYIQDRKQRLTIITDHAEGVTALQEGQLVLMLDRRVLYNDGRGTDEGLADSGTSCQRHYILLENFIETPRFDPISHIKAVQLPSFRANYLSNTFNYDIDIFILDKDETENCMYAFIPLIRARYPCDVALLNYRTILDDMSGKPSSPAVHLMILHRQSFTCRINYEALVHCDVNPHFSIENILRSAKSIFKTNLAGTYKGTRLDYVNIEDFPPMELLPLLIHS